MAGICGNRGLVDVFRRCNPGARRYTFMSRANGALARHDRIYAPAATLAHVLRCCAEGVPARLTDHSPVVHSGLKGSLNG
eukprot:302239-Chlamydomonas_euryale.AAC.1